MKKQTISAAAIKQAKMFAENCKNIIKGNAKGENRPAAFSIVCKYDDKSEPEIKTALRDTRLDQFDMFFQNAINYGPDMIEVIVFDGAGPNAFPLKDSSNIIRLTEKKQKAKFALQGTPEPANNDQSIPTSLELRQQKFEAEMQARELAYQNQRKLEEKDKEIERLRDEIKDNEDTIAEYEKGVDKLEAEVKDLKDKFGMNAEGLFSAGLKSLALAAAQNPGGKILGVIPTTALAGMLGLRTGTNQLSEGNQAKTYKHEHTESITQWVDDLDDEDFAKVYIIFNFLATDPGNITYLQNYISKTDNNNQLKSSE